MAIPASPFRTALAAAAQRARAEGLVAVRRSDGVWTCKDYTITPTGPRAQDVVCSCPAGSHGRICKHQAVAIYGRKYGLSRVAARPANVLPFRVRESTPAEIAETEALKAETLASLIAAHGVEYVLPPSRLAAR